MSRWLSSSTNRSPLGGYSHRRLGTEPGRHLVLIAIIFEVQDVETVRYGSLRGWVVLAGLRLGRPFKGLGALIHIPIDLAALVFTAITDQWVPMVSQGPCTYARLIMQVRAYRAL